MSLPLRLAFTAQAIALVIGANSTLADEIKPKIDAIGIQLFYASSGKLSEDIGPPSTFSAHNTIIGEGDAREPATDLLVTVRLSIAQKQGNSSVPLVVKVTDAKGKVQASRRFTSLFFNEGRTVQAVFVPDATCAGKLTVEASLGKVTKTQKVSLDCGE